MTLILMIAGAVPGVWLAEGTILFGTPVVAFALQAELVETTGYGIVISVAWIAGTVLTALVVGKLLLVDLGNTGTVARIVSFLGVGGLLPVAGYFAPAPPRRLSGEEPT